MGVVGIIYLFLQTGWLGALHRDFLKRECISCLAPRPVFPIEGLSLVAMMADSSFPKLNLPKLAA